MNVVEWGAQYVFGDDDLVGFGYVGDRVGGQRAEPSVFGRGIEQHPLLRFALEVHAVEDVAQKIVDLHAHGRVVVVQIGGGQHLVRVADLQSQRQDLATQRDTTRHGMVFSMLNDEARMYGQAEGSKEGVGNELKGGQLFTFSRALVLRLGLYEMLVDKLLASSLLSDSYMTDT